MAGTPAGTNLRPVINPRSGEALKLAQRDDSVILYSVGPNSVDDGGRPLRMKRDSAYVGDVVLRLNR